MWKEKRIHYYIRAQESISESSSDLDQSDQVTSHVSLNRALARPKLRIFTPV